MLKTHSFSSRLAIVPAVVLGLAARDGRAQAQDFAIDWYTIDGGGVINSNDGQPDGFKLSATSGQPDAGAMSGGEFALTGGFWFRTPLGDCNDTGTVNLTDYVEFQGCLSGPGGGIGGTGCECDDVDFDIDVDLLDFAEFQNSFTRGSP